MKKTIIGFALAFMAFAAFGMTGDEAFASKNWYTIDSYCKEKDIDFIQFVFKTQNASYDDAKTILNTYSNNVVDAYYYWNTYDLSYFQNSVDDFKANVYDFQKIGLKTGCYMLTNNMVKINYDTDFRYIYAKDFVTKNTDYKTAVIVAKIVNEKINKKNITTDFILLIDCNEDQIIASGDYATAFDIAIYKKDVDKIIDYGLKVKDITAEEANGLIAPLNAVEADYRKDEILKLLKNINSWCTIKLYDDQATWEPILAKIRAMIELRK